MGAISQILGGFGLSAASGLNAYIPLLIVGFLGRLNYIQLSSPFDALTNEWVLGTLVVLEAIELFVDKIPGLDHLNDLIQTIIRPTAGAVLFAADAQVISNLHPTVAVILGLLTAFSVHATKATVRPAVTVGTAGCGNWLVSLLEDIASIILTITALVAPILVLLFAVLFVLLLFRWLSRRGERRAAKAAAASGGGNLKWPH